MNVEDLIGELQTENPKTPIVFVVDGKRRTEEPNLYFDKGIVVIEV